MSRFILLFLSIILVQINSIGQDTTLIKYRITTSPLQYIFNNYSLAFEKTYKRHTYGLELGYRFNRSHKINNELHNYSYDLNYNLQNFFNYLYNAYSVSLNSKYYFKNNRFIELNIFYRYWWFTNKYCEFYDEHYNFTKGVKTEKQNVYGIKFLYGKSFNIKSSGKIKPIIDLYCGIGLRYKNCEYKIVSSQIENIDFENIYLPSFHLGIKMGIGR